MVERNLRLVILVAIRRAHFAVLVVTESGIVLVANVTGHGIYSLILISLDCETILRATLVVRLGSTKSGQRKLVSIIDALREVDEPVVAVEVSSLDISVALTVSEEGGHSPAVFHESGRNGNAFLVHAVVTHAIPH